MDNDLEQMTREQLIAELQKLRDGIRLHRDSTRHELCWHHPLPWGMLPEKIDPMPVVPAWPEFIRGVCAIGSPSTNKRLMLRAQMNHSSKCATKL